MVPSEGPASRLVQQQNADFADFTDDADWLRWAGRTVAAGAVISAICDISVICVRRSITRDAGPSAAVN